MANSKRSGTFFHEVPSILAPVVQGAFVQSSPKISKKSERFSTTPTHNSHSLSATKENNEPVTPERGEHLRNILMEGDKNHGFGILYHNMKHGQNSVKFLQDLLRESASTEDVYAKHLTKLAKQAANTPTVGTFAPMFDIIKVMAEKLSSCHVDVVLKLQDIIKELSKYTDEQKGKHKQVKDELSGTADALSLIHSTSAALKRSKDKYNQQCLDAERLRKSNALAKDIEKAEAKSKKSCDEYKTIVDKYSNVRSDFEQKMTESAKRFQDVEEAHLKHMKSVLDSYILSYENAGVLINQVHQEFRRQVAEHTIETLIKQYSESKGTGTEKPGPIVFEECDVSGVIVDAATVNGGGGGAGADDGPAPVASKPSKLPIGLPFRRKKAHSRKAPKDTVSAGSKDTDKDAESIESPDKDSSVKIDDEGFTIRPETPKSAKDSWGFGSSDSDSDSDDYAARKIRVKINPKGENVSDAAGSDLDTLNAITSKLTLSSPTPVGGKRLSRRKSDITRRRAPAPPGQGPGPAIAPRKQPRSLSEMPEESGDESKTTTPSKDQDLAAKSPDTPDTAGSLQSLCDAFSPQGTPARSATTPKRFTGAVRVLPGAGKVPSDESSPGASPARTPVPKPRVSVSESKKRLGNKLDNRFSTMFVPFKPKEASDTFQGATQQPPVASKRLPIDTGHVSEQLPTARPRTNVLSSTSIDRSATASSGDSVKSSRSSEEIEQRPSFFTAKGNLASGKSWQSMTNLSLRDLVESSDVESNHTQVRRSSMKSWVSFADAESARATAAATAASASDASYGGNKNKDSSTDKTEKSMSDELMDLFGNKSSGIGPPSLASGNHTPAPLAPATGVTGNNFDSLAGLFASKPVDSPATVARNEQNSNSSHLSASSLPQSSSNVSLNNLFIMPPAEKEENQNHQVYSSSGGEASADPGHEVTPSHRPTELTLNSAYKSKGGSNTPSAPLASSESWSSISSVGGTPMDSFASSRGPSPLTLMHGDPIPIAVAFTETLNAYFKGNHLSKCMVKITGEVQISFPAGIVRAFTSNPNPPVLSFKIKGCAAIKDFSPNQTLLFHDSSQSDNAQQNFWFNMSSLTTHVKKMAEKSPNSPYYNIQVLTYQISTPSGSDLVPLHISSHWQCADDFTDLRIEYKYNSKTPSNLALKNVQFIVPIDGAVTNVESEPQAAWNPSQKRLAWKLAAPLSGASPDGQLHSRLGLASGPGKATALAAQFMSEGGTATGADFELSGTGYRLSLVKKRFASGKYLSDCT